MAMNPVRASTRVSIAWGDGPASEDTDTLVLTIDGQSLDLRVFIHGEGAGTIDWATVGAVSQGAGHTKCEVFPTANPALRWTHLLDSRPAPPTGSADEGTFSVQDDGDVLEEGTMWNPKSGRDEAYREVWRRLPVDVGWPYCVLERVDGAYGAYMSDGRAEAHAHAGPRAFLGRIGRRALGLARTPTGAFAAFRDEMAGGVWGRKYDFGVDDAGLPTLPIDQPAWAVGDTVQLSHGDWVVRAAGTCTEPKEV